MAGPDSVPVDTVLANGVNNGVKDSVNGHRPQTPSMSGLSLTEYSANPSPPSPQSEDHQARIRSIIPEEFILPNGHPDVRIPIAFSLSTSRTYNEVLSQWLRLLIAFVVSPPYTHIPCLRSMQRDLIDPRYQSVQPTRMQCSPQKRRRAARL